MSAPTKTLSVTLLSPQTVTNNSRAVGTAVDLSGVHTLGLMMWMARTNTSAHASPWAQLVLEGCPSATDDSMFAPIATLIMPAGASIASTTTSSSISAGATSFSVSSATNIAAGALLLVGDASASNFEIVRVQSISGTTFTIDGAFQYSHGSGQGVVSQAERVAIPAIDVTGLARCRVALLNQSGQSVIGKALGVTTVL